MTKETPPGNAHRYPYRSLAIGTGIAFALGACAGGLGFGCGVLLLMTLCGHR